LSQGKISIKYQADKKYLHRAGIGTYFALMSAVMTTAAILIMVEAIYA
jgi:hypothetical protein